jgi:hypothetical protein
MYFIPTTSHYSSYTHYSNDAVFKVRVDLGIADHVWQDKRAKIARSVEALGDKFRPAMRAAWLIHPDCLCCRAYIRSILHETGHIDRA